MIGAATAAAFAQDAPPGSAPDTPPAEGADASASAPSGEGGATTANPFEGRPVAEVRFEGLSRVSARYARNQVRVAPGRPLEWEVVRADLRRLERLGEFERVEAEVLINADRSVVVLYRVSEAPIIRDIVVVGNREISDQEIAQTVGQVVSLIAEVPIDQYRIGRAQRAIEDLYREKGYFQVRVTVDDDELEENGVVLFRVREGQRTQVTGIRFEGNEAFEDKKLRPEIKTKKRVLFFNAPLDTSTLDEDVAALIRFHADRGYLDARAARDIRISPDGAEAIITFIIDEGPLYTLRRVTLADSDTPPEVLGVEQIRGLMPIKPGDPYVRTEVQGGIDAVRDAYRQMGYVDVGVFVEERRAIDEPGMDLILTINEGGRFRTGLVVVQGNELTQSKVIHRLLDIRPGRWLDGTAVDRSKNRLRFAGVFEVNPQIADPPEITIQPEDPEFPGQRDVIVEVAETNTGSISFGAAVSSDAGLIGSIAVSQRNFDLFDFPDSPGELFRGRAFRGAGQTFNLTLQPGTEVSTYAISLSEPSLLETEYGLSASLFFRDRVFSEFDERRFGGRFRFGRAFGTRWTGGLSVRAENVELSDIEPDAPVDIFEVEDPNTITSLGFDLARTTTDNRFRPTRGTRTEIGVEQIGALGGSFNFTRLNLEHAAFLTIDRDDFGRATVLSLRGQFGWIPQEDESPIYERFYLGGRSFRGFDFRGIGPVGVRNDTGELGDDKVGGDFLFFAGVEIEKPIWQDIVAGVIFVDSGTIAEDISFSEYRVSVGAGVRLYLPQFGQAPLAFDFGFPILKEDTDDTRTFSFAVDLPF